jgi:non-specific serine/threonine protein kinase
MRLASGATVGPYTIVEFLAAGGMGEVYRARDPRLGRDVAIKVLGQTADSDRLQRFEREARATAILAHPNILTIFDVGTHEGLPFLVCELLEGQTLRARLASGPFEPARAIELALQLVRGIAAAHTLKIVHRDLKPENLFLTRDGLLKILDFGLAKLVSDPLAGASGGGEAGPGGGTATLSLSPSTPGLVIGTLTYMAPEQLRGEPVDERADLFAAGAILYELVAGESPFRMPSNAETIAAILHQTPPPPSTMLARSEAKHAASERTERAERGQAGEHRRSAQLPTTLERVILRCLEKDPSHRFQTASDLVFALETLLGDVRGAEARGETARASAALDGVNRAAPIASEPSQAGGAASRTPRSGQTPAFASGGGEARGQASADARSIAVLPFADMSPTRDQDYLCEGIAEELINSLTHIDGLRVAARSSTFQFRGSDADVQAIGARLGVATVLEGGVRKAGDRLRVTVRLVNVADGYQRWSERYDRKLEDVFAVQDDIAESVATALRGLLSPREKEALRRPDASVEAYEYFLRGRQLLHSPRRVRFEAAQRMFERAIEIDPSYAPAHAGLADVLSWLYEWYGAGAGGPETERRARDAAMRASERALELGPGLSEAHASRAFALSIANRYEEADREYGEAMRLNPNSFDAHYHAARSAFEQGQNERSAELFRKASALRQEDFQCPILLGQALRILGRREEADAAIAEGVRRAERQLDLDPTDSRALSLGATALEDLGQRERALSWSARAMELDPDETSVMANGACLYARAGHKEQALAILERMVAHGIGKRAWIERDPDYESLRDDPRFQAVLAKLR